MDISTTHRSHPPTSAYVREKAGPFGYDGCQDAFEWAGGRALSPTLASDSSASALAARGWVELGGLLVPPSGAESWAMMLAREPRLDVSGFMAHSRGNRAAGCDWKIFMEIYFDDYHVEAFHPGLSSLADCGALEWLWEPGAQAQRLGASAMRGSGSLAYATLWGLSEAIFGSSDPVAAVWAAIYPSTMIEWLAGGLAISVAVPDGAGRSINETVFAYPMGIAEKHPDFVAAHQAAYWETAFEDDDIASRIQKGRQALSLRGDDERGPACPHLEAGVVAFHDWMALAAWRGWRRPPSTREPGLGFGK